MSFRGLFLFESPRDKTEEIFLLCPAPAAALSDLVGFVGLLGLDLAAADILHRYDKFDVTVFIGSGNLSVRTSKIREQTHKHTAQASVSCNLQSIQKEITDSTAIHTTNTNHY